MYRGTEYRVRNMRISMVGLNVYLHWLSPGARYNSPGSKMVFREFSRDDPKIAGKRVIKSKLLLWIFIIQASVKTLRKSRSLTTSCQPFTLFMLRIAACGAATTTFWLECFLDKAGERYGLLEE